MAILLNDNIKILAPKPPIEGLKVLDNAARNALDNRWAGMIVYNEDRGDGLSEWQYLNLTSGEDLADNSYWEPLGSSAGSINEAPIDGEQYARQNGAWQVIESDGGAFIPLPTEGTSGQVLTTDGDGVYTWEDGGGGGGGGVVNSIVGTSGEIDVDDLDPENPIISIGSDVIKSGDNISQLNNDLDYLVNADIEGNYVNVNSYGLESARESDNEVDGEIKMLEGSSITGIPTVEGFTVGNKQSAPFFRFTDELIVESDVTTKGIKGSAHFVKDYDNDGVYFAQIQDIIDYIFELVSNGGLLDDAPSDGTAYVRKNGAWEDITTV